MNILNFNDTLTNYVVIFEQPGPALLPQCYMLLCPCVYVASDMIT